MFGKLILAASLFCTAAALLSQPPTPVGRRSVPNRYRRSVQDDAGPVLSRRASVLVETFDGSPVDPLVVDFLDQFEYMQKEKDNAVVGTPRYTAILSEYSAVSSTLSVFMDGYATFVPATATGTASIPDPTILELPEDGEGDFPLPEDDGAESEDEPTTDAEPKPTVDAPGPSPTAAPQPTRDGPVIVTVIPQPNTSIVVIASDGTTNTITRTATAGKAKETVTVTKGASEEGSPRAATATTSLRPGQTLASNSQIGNGALGRVANAREGLWLVPIGVMLLSVL